MESPENNLLLRLHKWAHRQDENFLTDTFAHLLQHLLSEEPEAAANLLRRLTAGFFQLTVAEARHVAIRTQVTLTEGTPDLELRTLTQLAFVEVKVESEPDAEQLRRYRRLLSESGLGSTALILLTRYPADLKLGTEGPVPCVRWYQVAEWLEEEAGRYRFKPVSAYLVNQFLGFLGARNMVMGQVTWELAGGARALRTLTDMLYEVASACGLPAQHQGSWDYMGIKMGASLKRPDYYIGIYLDRPEVLVFETGYRKVDAEAAARLGVEGVYEWTTATGHGWQRKLDLNSEKAAFFVRTKSRQMQLLEEFLRECLDTVKRIEIGGDAGLPDEEDAPDAPGSPPPTPPLEG
jgi:hypothetical protein